MKKDVTKIPKDKSLLDFIAEMGERTKKAWIYVYKKDILKLRKKEGIVEFYDEDDLTLYWEATLECPSKRLVIRYEYEEEWLKIIEIQAKNVIKKSCADPEEIIFLKME